MNNEDLAQMIGLAAPWGLEGSTVDHDHRRVELTVGCAATEWMEGEVRLHVHSWEERTWRHLDLWQYETVLRARVPRLFNPRTGKTSMAQVPLEWPPWIEPCGMRVWSPQGRQTP
jgi:hypothetical protein